MNLQLLIVTPLRRIHITEPWLRIRLARRQSPPAGRNSIPIAAVIPSEADALRLIGRGADVRRFNQLAHATLAAFPQLHSWLRAHPLELIEHADTWPRSGGAEMVRAPPAARHLCEAARHSMRG